MKLKPVLLAVALGLVPLVAFASSHREAPFVAAHPKVDATDFYMFMSYGPTAPKGYVTLVANYDPLQDPWGGPNYFALNENAAYDINIDNNGDAKPDIVFRFQFKNTFKNLAVPAATAGTATTAIPLINIGPISGTDAKNLNRVETYTVTEYASSAGAPLSATGAALMTSSGSDTFTKPMDNIGNKSIPDYTAYAQQYIYKNVTMPNCSQPVYVFVGQRKDPFVVNLGEIFDLVNLNPVGPPGADHNVLSYDNVTALELQVPASCLGATKSSPVIGGWTTAYLRQARVINPAPPGSDDKAEVVGGAYTQVSRLGAPLVNEVVIGLPDKNSFNASRPVNDTQFLHYVTNPSLSVLLHVLYPSTKVPDTPRNDLVAAFLTGIKGLNQPANVVPGEELRLNTSIAPTPATGQKALGVLAGDLAGFPNGRRPYDDTTDIELTVMEGILCGYNSAMNCGSETAPPNGSQIFVDGARSPGPTMATEKVMGAENPIDTYLDHFPYLMPPLPGSPNGKNGIPAP